MNRRIEYAACSVQGSGRKKNEDNLLCHNRFLPTNHSGTDEVWHEMVDGWSPAMFCVFDGLNSESRGEEASFLACKIFQDQFRNRGTLRQKIGPEVFVRNLCRQADQGIRQQTGKRQSMGSTVAGILFGDGDLICFHVGNSRIYRLRERVLKRLTQDHVSFLKGPGCGMLSQALGTTETGMEIEPDILTIPFRDQDIYLLCTDGISRTLSGRMIREILVNQNNDITQLAEMLVREAVRRGSEDDGTVILCRLRQEGRNVMEDIRLPQHWSQWKCKEEIGSGAYGTVYRAEKDEKDGSKSEAAIKIIYVPRDDSEASALYREYGSMEEVSRYYAGMISGLVDEIQTLMSLKGSRNIVQIEDYHVERRAEDEYGWTIYIRMEFLQSLSDYMMEHEMTEKDAVRLGMDICSALEECRKANIIHRDIKPDNILVTEDGQFKLGDFGVAKRLDVSNMSYSMKGTFNYMSPEVYYGRPYDHTADIYSLGIVLFRILNHNRDPFIDSKKQIVHFRDREEALGKRMSGQPVPDPVDASSAMAMVIRKACAFLSQDRYQTSALMAEDLEKVITGGQSAEEISEVSKPTEKISGKEIKESSGSYTNDKTKSPSEKKSFKKIWILTAAFVFMAAGIAGAAVRHMDSFRKDENNLILDHVASNPKENITCTLDEKGTMTISGKGALRPMDDSFSYPWDEMNDQIRKVVIEEGIVEVGEFSFYECRNLSEVILPSGLKWIGEAAFEGCTVLDKIPDFPPSVERIDKYAFKETKWLNDLADKDGYAVINGILLQYSGQKQSVVIPEEIKEISCDAFYSNQTLQEVTLNDGLECISDGAFDDCKKLKEVNNLEGNKSITKVGCNVFRNTGWLENQMSRGDHFAVIDHRLYGYDGREMNIRLSEDVHEILGGAFSNNRSIETVSITGPLTGFGMEVFDGCTQLKQVEWDHVSIKEIPFAAFRNCSSLEEIVIPETVNYIGEETFEYCGALKKLTLTNKPVTIESNAFDGCGNLEEITGISQLDRDTIAQLFGGTYWYDHVYEQ